VYESLWGFILALMEKITTLKHYLSLIKFSHTIFAMPFALLGFFLGVLDEGLFQWADLLLVIACMVFARSAAMAFNRYLDRDIDARNPRTAQREIPAGIIQPTQVLRFVWINAVLFMAAAWLLNPLCFYLSPIALAIILGYSYTKRFTALCHFVLGLGLALAPIGAYLAVTGHFSILPIVYGLAVLSWVAGFDIIYALQDEAFDRHYQLHSIPAALGKVRALQLARGLHFFSAVAIILAGMLLAQRYVQVGWLHWAAVAVFCGLLVFQHRLVRPNDLSRVNLAFFTTNGVASLVFGLLVIADFYL